ncbi:hypothetical protein TNCV_313641 [Trichonephila clavipes]|nr:hypothetical protein TNCV_313641 [Trichonephila clavipes]
MRLEELERVEKIRLEELVKEQALKEKELKLKFDLERFKIESGFRVSDESNDSIIKCSVTSNLNFKKLIPDFHSKQSDISLYQVIFERQAKRASIEKKEWVGQLLDNWANLKSATQIAELFDNYEDVRKVNSKPMDRLGNNDKILTYSGVKEKENRFGKTSPRLGASVTESTRERTFEKRVIQRCYHCNMPNMPGHIKAIRPKLIKTKQRKLSIILKEMKTRIFLIHIQQRAL